MRQSDPSRSSRWLAVWSERTEGSVHVVGERSVRLRRQFEKTAGGIRSANADMSSVKAGEKPARRKPKVSCSTFIGAG